jgi:hypothetical protein
MKNFAYTKSPTSRALRATAKIRRALCTPFGEKEGAIMKK